MSRPLPARRTRSPGGWLWACAAWAGCWLGGAALGWPLSVRMHPPDGPSFVAWHTATLYHARGVLIALNLAGTLVLALRMLSRAAPDARGRLARTALPIALLALGFPLLLMKDVWPAAWIANGLFYGGIGLLSIPLAAWFECLPRNGNARITAAEVTLVAALSTAAYWASGIAYTHWCGEHAGDEGHYIIQAASLHEDGDLDIRNQYEALLGDRMADYRDPAFREHKLHISPASRGGHWYSYHTPGLAWLTFWTMPLGIAARHAVLGLVGGLALAGAYLLCRTAGAGRAASGVLIFLYGASLYATVYASRMLPEMLGAALATWLLAAAVHQRRHPVLAVAGGALLVSAMPWAHLRFLPAAGLGAAYFCLHNLFDRDTLRLAWIRVGAFCLLAGSGLLGYRLAQLAFFEGGYSHPVGAMFMNHPSGIFKIFSEPGALADVLPLAMWLVPCGLVAWWWPSPRRHLLAACAVLFAVPWVIACSAGNYGGGATLGGRFLVAGMPLLLPAAALAWQRSNPVLRWWMTLLGLVSIGLNLLMFSVLPGMEKSFSVPFGSLPVLIPLLRGWHDPWAGQGILLAVALVHLLLAAAPSAWPARATGLLVGLLLAANLGLQFRQAGYHPPAPVQGDRDTAFALLSIHPGIPYLPSLPDDADPALAGLANLVADARHRFQPLRVVAGTDPSGDTDRPLIRQETLEPNDWQGRPIAWSTLMTPFDPPGGWLRLGLEGRGGPGRSVRIAVREGGHTLIETDFVTGEDGAWTWEGRFHADGDRGLLYLLLHLDSPGSLDVDRLTLTPRINGPAFD